MSKNEESLDVLAEHLMLGNEKGEFMVYDITGDLILRQRLHIHPVLCIRSHPASMGQGISFESRTLKYNAGSEREALEDISVIFTDVLCCIPLPELLAFIRLHEAGSGQRHDPTLKLAHGKFGFPKNQSSRLDGLHLGVQTPSLKSQLKNADNDVEETKISILSGTFLCDDVYGWMMGVCQSGDLRPSDCMMRQCVGLREVHWR